MARVTRSKKLEIAEDQTTLAIQTPSLPDTVSHIQEPLIEIARPNTMPSVDEGAAVAAELKNLKAAYRNIIGAGNKGRKGHNKKKGKPADPEERPGDKLVVEDYQTANTNQMYGESRLLQSGEEENVPFSVEQSLHQHYSAPTASEKNLSVAVGHLARPPSPVVCNARRQMAKTQTAEEVANRLVRQATYTHSADFHVQNETVLSSQESKSIKDGSNVNHITKPPAKSAPKTLEQVEEIYGLERPAAPIHDAGEDSFVEQITCRSPAKPVSRIEDSVEALDQMDEVLEALNEATMAERMLSPEDTGHEMQENPGKTTTSLGNKAARHKTMTEASREQNGTKQPLPKPGHSSMRVKTTAPRTTIIKRAMSMTFKPTPPNTPPAEHLVNDQPPKKASVKRPISLLSIMEPVKSTKPVTRPVNFELPGEVVARRLREQREARLAQRQSIEDSFPIARSFSTPRVKSTKPPTKSTFELPGDAISRRKREAHEARLKAQEEEERKRREFKAKPLRKSVMPNMLPRDTVASRARQGKTGTENAEDVNLTVSKRDSNIGAHRPSIFQVSMANTSAPRSPGPVASLERKPSTRFNGPSMSGLAMQRTVSASDVQIQRQRAKEIYNRDNKLSEDIEREKREREIAAKRSREEAAERGRQASREWAEKHRAKKMAEGDKGMTAGYGPGGQMGLAS